MSVATDPSRSTILVVDDNAANLSVVADHLQALDLRVLTAMDGQDALETMQSTRPDLILLDVVMPGMNGFEVCRRLKADKTTQDIPIIFMTVLAEIKHKVKGFEMGGVDYVTKPVQPQELLARVRTHLALRAAQRQLDVRNEQLEHEIAGHKSELRARIQAERALQRAHDELERQVEKRTAELVRANASLQVEIAERKRAEQEKDTLLAKVSQSHQALRELSARLAEAQELERKQLARELHDRVGQNLSILGFVLNIIRKQMSQFVPEAESQASLARVDDALTLVEQTTEDVRDVMAELRPSVLDDYGLAAALRWYGDQFSQRTGIPFTLQGDKLTARLPALIENTLFRIAQEALSNVAKYAHASQVTISLTTTDEISLVVADDGVGFDPTPSPAPAQKGRWGLLNMAERAMAVGGECRIESTPGQGTSVVVQINT
ncbi:MAG: response regulator [Thermoflexales bacterium]|nr:response regulator [Thermoflexales bacterium]